MSFNLLGRLFLCLMIVLLSSCANNVNRIAEEHKVMIPDTVIIDREMEDVVTEIFTETDLPWSDESVEIIKSAMAGLDEESDYMYTIMELGNTVPYYELRATTNRTFRLINKLSKELTTRSEMPNATTRIGKFAFMLLVEKIQNEAKSQKLNLLSEEASINKKADAADLAQLKKLYDTMAPLVKTAVAL